MQGGCNSLRRSVDTVVLTLVYSCTNLCNYNPIYQLVGDGSDAIQSV